MLAAFKLRAVPINVNYRYVEDELRYLLDDADATAVVVPRRVRAEARRRSAIRTARRCTRFIAVDDGTDAHLPPTRSSTKPRSRPPRADARLRTTAPADDLYILYTGGTTGMPKGVMWRHEDMFFGAMGGGGRCAARRSPRPKRSPSAARRRAPAASRRARSCTAPRTGWPSAALFSGGTVDHPDRAPLRPARALAAHRRAKQANFLVIVGDAFAAPARRSARQRPEVADARPVVACACCSRAARSSRPR